MTESLREIEVHIRSRLHNRYSIKNGWCLLEEVTIQGHQQRRIDAVAIGLRQNNAQAHGFEIKTNRSDWLNELDDLDKSSAALERVDNFWVVAPKGVVKLEEIPTGWGLMHPTKNQIRVDRRADHTGSDGLGEFAYELIRKQRNLLLKERESTWREAWERGRESAVKSMELRVDRADREAKDLSQMLAEEQLSIGQVRRSAPMIRAMDKIDGKHWLGVDRNLDHIKRVLQQAVEAVDGARLELSDAVAKTTQREESAA